MFGGDRPVPNGEREWQELKQWVAEHKPDELMPWDAVQPASQPFSLDWRRWHDLSNEEFASLIPTLITYRADEDSAPYSWLQSWHERVQWLLASMDDADRMQLRAAGGMRFSTPVRNGVLKIQWLIDHESAPGRAHAATG